jgi:Tfp pilus assembly protein PilE
MVNGKKISFVEIIVAISIILLVTLIVYPKFLDIIRKSNEATTRANLTALRSAIAIYYGDNEGKFPTEKIAEELVSEDGKYIKLIPEVYCPPYHNITNEITTSPTGDSGKWAYQVEDSEDRQAGELWIDCDQKDSNGVVWSTY